MSHSHEISGSYFDEQSQSKFELANQSAQFEIFRDYMKEAIADAYGDLHIARKKDPIYQVAPQARIRQIGRLTDHIEELLYSDDILCSVNIDQIELFGSGTSDDVNHEIQRGGIEGTQIVLDALIPDSIPEDMKEIYFLPWTRAMLERKDRSNKDEDTITIYFETSIAHLYLSYCYAKDNKEPYRSFAYADQMDSPL